MNEEKIAVLGAGSWGSALAHLLGGKGYKVTLWDRDEALVAAIQTHGVNPKYLPGIPFGENVTAAATLKETLADASCVLFAVASDGIRDVASASVSFLSPQCMIVSAAKGLEEETGATPSEVLTLLLADAPYAGLAVLSGPNLATELVRGVPTAGIVASSDPTIARRAQAMLMTETSFRVYTQSDVKGVELGGALKNVLAIGAGLSDGLGYGDNTKAALLTRGLMEMTQLGVAAGGKALTFLGLSGVGDLIATASSRLSRNYRVGLGLASGKRLADVLAELHQAAEGVATARAAILLSERYGVSVPVFAALHAVLYQSLSPRVAVGELMTRAARDEFAA